MSPEKLADLMQEGRMISAVENVIFPVIDSMVSDRVARMTSEFASKKTDFIADVAYIAALRDLQNTLRQKQKSGHKAYERLQL